jgi:Protein of unknown function (DUF1592)/Protein of unknown function (DUF1588)/Protein of unknown function (DUF1595)
MKPRIFAALACLVLVACGSTARNPNQHGSTAGTSAGGATGAAGAAAGGGESSEDCGPGPLAPASLVRLSFGEINASLVQLFDAEAAAAIGAEEELEGASDAFPPLTSSREGPSINDSTFPISDRLARNAGAYVRENFAAVTQCTANYACVTDFVMAFAQRAFRRALTDEEQATLEKVVAGAEALGATPEQGAEYGVYAALESPHFLYRTEFGPPAAAAQAGEVRLSDDELASAIAFFLTGAPPDQGLLDAASAHDLGGPDQLAPHVERLLTSPAGRQHLERTLGIYFGFSWLQNVVIDSAVYPGFSSAVRQSMTHELKLLLRDTLWTQPVSSLLTSRTAHVDASLAELYGVELPATGLDANGFAQLELPENRAGLLTRAGSLTARSRPDGPSVVGRGLWVANAFVCAVPPPFPDMAGDLAEPLPPGSSQREMAEQRMTTAPCDGCHVEIDPYGLALDEYDGVGRFRSLDPEGRPIDTAVELPAAVGSAIVKGGVGLSEALSGKVFATCLAQKFLQYALPLTSEPDTKAIRCAAKALTGTENPTFTDVLSNVALSRAFATRKR